MSISFCTSALEFVTQIPLIGTRFAKGSQVPPLQATWLNSPQRSHKPPTMATPLSPFTLAVPAHPTPHRSGQVVPPHAPTPAAPHGTHLPPLAPSPGSQPVSQGG